MKKWMFGGNVYKFNTLYSPRLVWKPNVLLKYDKKMGICKEK